MSAAIRETGYAALQGVSGWLLAVRLWNYLGAGTNRLANLARFTVLLALSA